MEQIKKRMESLRVEADDSAARAEEFNKKCKELEADNLQKEQEITSLRHNKSVLEAEVEKLEAQVKTYKDEAGAGAQAGNQAESAQRRIQVLEEEAEATDRRTREITEQFRQADIKSGHLQRKVDALVQELDQAQKKVEEMNQKYDDAKKELEAFAADLANI